MKIKRTFLIVICAVMTMPLFAREREEGPALHGIRLGEKQAEAKQKLARMATFIRDDEGNEAYKLKNDPEADSIIVGFDAEHRVRYITIVAKPNRPLKCEVLGSDPHQKGGTGIIEFTKQVGDPEDHVLAIARGASRDHLTTCSLKRVGAKSQEDEEEERERRNRKH